LGSNTATAAEAVVPTAQAAATVAEVATIAQATAGRIVHAGQAQRARHLVASPPCSSHSGCTMQAHSRQPPRERARMHAVQAAIAAADGPCQLSRRMGVQIGGTGGGGSHEVLHEGLVRGVGQNGERGQDLGQVHTPACVCVC